MSSKRSLVYSSSSDENVTQYTDVEQNLSTTHTTQAKDPVFLAETFQTERKGKENDIAPIQFEIVVTDALPDEDNKGHLIADEQRPGASFGDVKLRQNRHDLEDAGRRAFQKQARLSRMLQDEESSSDDDEALYTIGAIPPSSMAVPQKTLTLSYRTKDEVDAVEANTVFAEPETPASENEFAEESVPMKLLTKVVNPQVLSDVKAQFKKVEVTKRKRRSYPRPTEVEEPSPARIWELRKKQQNEKTLLNKTQAAKLKAGWKIRQCLSSLPEGETVHTLYFTLVKRGMLREVDAMFSLAKVSRKLTNFNKNYHDEDDKSALTIAIDNKDEAMTSKLIEREVSQGMSIYHAIETDFMEGLKLLLLRDPSRNMKITTENPYFQIGMTPMLLAAHNNNYRMLFLLHEYGHRLTELKDWSDGIHVAWESANEKRMICFAKSQPAYITLTTEVNNMDPMKYCLKEIGRLRRYSNEEHEFSTYYNELKLKYEDYMCCLLDFVSSSGELADLFHFDSSSEEAKSSRQLMTLMDSATTQRWKLGNRFELLEKASEENLVRFVTHQQSQLALSYLRYRSLPVLRNTCLSMAIGLLFPVLSILYVCAPNTGLGGIITHPVVSFNCHMMSDVAFAVVLLLKIELKNTTSDRLGEPLTSLEWLIMLWILGKWVQEIQECVNRGIRQYFRDNWNYTDIALLLLFTISIIIRIIDVVNNNGKKEHIPRYLWEPFEPRLIGEGLQAWGYVFFFIRLLGLTRVDRYLGPLQISLGRMVADVIRFLCLFGFVVGAFAFGLSDLYWYYSTDGGKMLLCQNNNTLTGVNKTMANGTTNCSKQVTAFSSLGQSALALFWALFGQFDITTMSLSGKHVYTETVGKTLIATYQVVAIIVMLNMLIAMMSNSYNATSEDEETAWKFHRTSIWIRFIRREVVRPPPMNLFPNPWRLRENFIRFKNFCRDGCDRDRTLTESVYDERGRRIGASTTLTSSKLADDAAAEINVKHAKTTGIPTWRYKKRNGQEGLIGQENPDVMDGEAEIRFSTLEPAPQRTARQIQKNNAGFSPAVLSGVKTAIKINFRLNESKIVLKKLVQRYKLKHLVKKSTRPKTNL